MKAYNFKCPKCGFDGMTEDEKNQAMDRKESPANFSKYDRIVKISNDGRIVDNVPCPHCDGFIIDKTGAQKYCSMEVEGGPLGGDDVLPSNAKPPKGSVNGFVPFYSKTLGIKIHNEKEIKEGYLQMWSKKVAEVEPIKPVVVAKAETAPVAVEPVSAPVVSAPEAVVRRGRPRKVENAEV